jgi:hypothetical protein
MGEYEKAIYDFKASSVQKKISKENEGGTDDGSLDSNDTDLSDVGLCSLSVHENAFNVIISLI